MASINELKEYEVRLTEQTIFELSEAIKQAKEEHSNINAIRVESLYSTVKFFIRLDVTGNQESVGYRFTSGEGK